MCQMGDDPYLVFPYLLYKLVKEFFTAQNYSFQQFVDQYGKPLRLRWNYPSQFQWQVQAVWLKELYWWTMQFYAVKLQCFKFSRLCSVMTYWALPSGVLSPYLPSGTHI